MHTIYTRAVFAWDEGLSTYRLIPEESVSHQYAGPVALCKGDDTAKATEEQQQQLQQQQAAYSAQLMSLMKTQFASQSGVLQYLQGKMQPLIDNPTGYDAKTLTSMRTSSDDQLSTQYEHAKQALNQSEFSRGASRDLPSGVNAQLDAGMAASEAADKASSQNQITQADATLAEQNKWNAVNVLSGVGAQYNPQSYASEATGAANSASSAGNSVASLSNAYTTSAGPSVGAILGGVAGGVFGAAGQAGGFGKLFCFVAAAVFGEPDDLTGLKTMAVRTWMTMMYLTHWYARPPIWMYQRTSKWLSSHKWMVRALTPLFHHFFKLSTEVR